MIYDLHMLDEFKFVYLFVYQSELFLSTFIDYQSLTGCTLPPLSVFPGDRIVASAQLISKPEIWLYQGDSIA